MIDAWWRLRDCGVDEYRDHTEHRDTDEYRKIPLDADSPAEKSAEESPDSRRSIDEPGYDNRRDAGRVHRDHEQRIRHGYFTEDRGQLGRKQCEARAQAPGEAEGQCKERC